MQKTILILLATLFFISCIPQYKKVEDPYNLKHQKVQEVENIEKDQIYFNTLHWMAKTFVSSKAVIEHKDQATGTIIGNTRFKFPNAFLIVQVKCVVTIECKDYKYRMTFDQFQQFLYPDQGWHVLDSEKLWNELKPKLDELNIDLLAYILKSNQETEW